METPGTLLQTTTTAWTRTSTCSNNSHPGVPFLDRLGHASSRTAKTHSIAGDSTSIAVCSRDSHGEVSSDVTLYHWDLPQALEDERRVASIATRRSASPTTPASWSSSSAILQVRWVTLNEPWCSAFLGYYEGVSRPGIAVMTRRTQRRIISCSPTAWDLQRFAQRQPDVEVGLTCTSRTSRPRPGRQRGGACSGHGENRLFLDPLFLGRYPADAPDLMRNGQLVRKAISTRSPHLSTSSG